MPVWGMALYSDRPPAAPKIGRSKKHRPAARAGRKARKAHRR